MMKFMKTESFLNTVNEWVRDGSNITAITTASYGEMVHLTSKNGASEELILYYNQEDFDNDDERATGD